MPQKSKYPWKEIQKFYDNDHSIQDIINKWGVCNRTCYCATLTGKLVTRSRSEAAKISRRKYPQVFTKERRQKLRDAMKRRLKEGTYPTLGKNNKLINQPSYPEKFLMEVIKNEFHDKDYEHEKQFGIYSLDFAWNHKKKCIEMDGEQHYVQESQIASDKRKNAYIKKEGWKLLRIRWSKMCKDSKFWINKANKFIGD